MLIISSPLRFVWPRCVPSFPPALPPLTVEEVVITMMMSCWFVLSILLFSPHILWHGSLFTHAIFSCFLYVVLAQYSGGNRFNGPRPPQKNNDFNLLPRLLFLVPRPNRHMSTTIPPPPHAPAWSIRCHWSNSTGYDLLNSRHHQAPARRQQDLCRHHSPPTSSTPRHTRRHSWRYLPWAVTKYTYADYGPPPLPVSQHY